MGPRETGGSSAEVEQTYGTITRRLIPFLVICYLSAFIDRSNLGLAKLQFTRDIGITEAAYGLGGGIFYLGYSLFEVPSNLVMARIGARLTLSRVMFLWSLVSAATALISSSYHFYIVRFLLGAAEAGFFPGVLLYLSHWAPAGRRARLTAYFMSAMALAGIISNPVSGAIMHGLDGAAGLHGWQWLFLAEGLPGCFLAVVAYFYLDDGPSKARWLTDQQKAIVLQELEQEAQAKAANSHARLLTALSDPRLYALALMAMALLSGLAALGLWTPTIVRRAGVTDVFYVGLLSALPYLFGLVSQQLVAHSSDRRGERRWHAALPALFGAAAWAALPWVTHNAGLSLVCLTCVGIGLFGATGPFWSMPTNYLRGTAAAGGIALITTIGSISAFLSPILIGWVAERTGSLDFGQYYLGALAAAGSLALVTVRPDRVSAAAR